MRLVSNANLPERATKRPLFYRVASNTGDSVVSLYRLSFEQCKKNILKMIELPGVSTNSKLSRLVREAQDWDELTALTGYSKPNK